MKENEKTQEVLASLIKYDYLEKVRINGFYKRYGKLGFFPVKYYRKHWFKIQTRFEVRGLSGNSNFRIYEGESFSDFNSGNLFLTNLNIMLYNLGYSAKSIVDSFEGSLSIMQKRLEFFEMELENKLNDGYLVYVPKNEVLKINLDKYKS